MIAAKGFKLQNLKINYKLLIIQFVALDGVAPASRYHITLYKELVCMEKWLINVSKYIAGKLIKISSIV